MPNSKHWYQQKRWIIPIIVIVLLTLIIVATPSSGSKPSTIDSGTANTTNEPKAPKEGDSLKGITRKELEDKYNTEKAKSKFKADEYAKSISGQEVVWIAKASDYDSTTGKGTNYVRAYMKGLSVYVNDPSEKFTNVEKNQLIKITGKIDRVSDMLGLSVYVNADSIEIIK